MLKTKEENKPAKFCGGSHLVVHKTKQATAVFDFTKTLVLCNWGAQLCPLITSFAASNTFIIIIISYTKSLPQ